MLRFTDSTIYRPARVAHTHTYRHRQCCEPVCSLRQCGSLSPRLVRPPPMLSVLSAIQQRSGRGACVSVQPTPSALPPPPPPPREMSRGDGTTTALKAKVQVLKRLHKSPINLGLILISLILLNGMLMLSREYTGRSRGRLLLTGII